MRINDIVKEVMDYCGWAGIDLEAAIRDKHEYNDMGDMEEKLYEMVLLSAEGRYGSSPPAEVSVAAIEGV